MNDWLLFYITLVLIWFLNFQILFEFPKFLINLNVTALNLFLKSIDEYIFPPWRLSFPEQRGNGRKLYALMHRENTNI